MRSLAIPTHPPDSVPNTPGAHFTARCEWSTLPSNQAPAMTINSRTRVSATTPTGTRCTQCQPLPYGKIWITELKSSAAVMMVDGTPEAPQEGTLPRSLSTTWEEDKIKVLIVASKFLFCQFKGTSMKVPGVTMGMTHAWNLNLPPIPSIAILKGTAGAVHSHEGA